jgi:large subunit ribosomal protein L18
MLKDRRTARLRRKRSIRKRISGVPAQPRLSVFRSARHIYAQIIDDIAGKTLVGVSTLTKEVRDQVQGLKKREAAEKVGLEIAKRCIALKIDQVVFDRGGYRYHGRVSALADGARKGGLKL